MNDLLLLRAPNLAIPHGFTTRAGGVSEDCYASLNLGFSTGDDREKVAENRRRVIAALGASEDMVCALHQVHGATVIEAAPGWHCVAADAMVSRDRELLLAIGVADCAPILFYDPVRRAVGAAHAGWRSTAQRIAEKVVKEMHSRYGSAPEDLQVAIGPCISGPNYQVGPEVKAAFGAAGFPAECCPSDDEGRYRLDLVAANTWLLERCGVKAEHVWASGACTYSDPERFFSHRRDGRRRGSHWAVIRLGE